MASSWFSPNAPQTNPTFDYDTAAAQIARQRALAQQLQQMAMTPQQGQFIHSGDFAGYAGGNSPLSILARAAAGYLSGKMNSDADTSQKQLSQDSINALQNALSNPSWAQEARADQVKQEGNEQDQRELNRMNDAVQANQLAVQQGAADPSGAQPFPVASGSAVGTPLPVQSVSPQPGAAPFVSGGGGQFAGHGAGGSWATPQAVVPPAAAAGAPMQSAVAQALAQSQPTPQPQAQPPKPVVPPMPTGAPPLVPPAQPSPPPQAAPQPDPNALTPQQQAEVAMAQQRTAAGLPVSDSRSMVDQAAAAAQPTPAQQLAQLAELQRTGPMGQQVANGMMQTMFTKDWGEIKNADGATIGVYNKRDPSQVMQFGGIGPGSKTVETALNLVKNTDWSKPDAAAYTNQTLVSMGMRPVSPQQGANMGMTPTERVDQNQKITDKQLGYTNAVSAIRDQLARLDRMDQLYDKTVTGPIMGHLPDWTNNRQELQNLIGSNNFAAVREAVDAAGGGSQRFTQGELQHFADGNGGLTMNLDAGPAHNIIAQQKALLQAKLQALQAAQQGLGGSNGMPTGAPARGQTFNGPSAAFASRFGGQ